LLFFLTSRRPLWYLTGVWNTTEWFGRAIISSPLLGAVQTVLFLFLCASKMDGYLNLSAVWVFMPLFVGNAFAIVVSIWCLIVDVCIQQTSSYVLFEFVVTLDGLMKRFA
jgi:hypothetical protein